MIKLVSENNLELINEINNELNQDQTTNQETETGIKLQWNPKGFVSSFKYMGLGMLGIFLITTIIIGMVKILNKIKK
ncbi:MAG: hypothetical protein J6V66_04475 [Clostridia bacterium]|nr:hypothetical protein [Clostridia bacterium]